MMRLVFCLAAALFVLSACAPAPSELEAQSSLDASGTALPKMIADTDVTVEVTTLSDGNWQVDYVFAAPQEQVTFPRSIGDYRRRTWQPVPETGTPFIVREDDSDTIRFETAQRIARFIVVPYTQRLPRDYRPFLVFSDGEGAIFLDQFRVRPSSDPEVTPGAEAAPEPDRDFLVGIRLATDGPILLKGARLERSAEYVLSGDDEVYAYLGARGLIEGNSYVGVIDPALPDWIAATFDSDLERLFDVMDRKWGRSLPDKATIYFAYGGADRQGYSYSGSVAGGDTLVLTVSGKALLDPDQEIKRDILNFFAHESAHLYQASETIRFGSRQQAWWHEGSADRMAVDALAALGLADGAYLNRRYRKRVDRCGLALEDNPLIGQRGNIPYLCGDLIAVMMDRALPGYTLYDLWNRVLSDAPPDLTTENTDEFILSTLIDMGADQAFIDNLKALLNERQEIGRNALLKAFEIVGIVYTLDVYGSIKTIDAS